MIYLSSHPKRPLVDHSLSMSSLVRSNPTISFPTSYKLVGVWDGLLVIVRRSSTASRLWSWTKI